MYTGNRDVTLILYVVNLDQGDYELWPEHPDIQRTKY